MTLFGSWLAMALCWRKGKRQGRTLIINILRSVLRFIYLDSIARLGTVATQSNAFCVFPGHQRQRWRFLI